MGSAVFSFYLRANRKMKDFKLYFQVVFIKRKVKNYFNILEVNI